MAGFHAAYRLFDASTGKALNVALWDTEAAVRATEEQVCQLRATAKGLSATL